MLSRADLDASVRMWAWLRPLLVLLFPEEVTNPPWGEPGTVSSPLRRIDAMGRALGLRPGRCLIKADSNLAVCGSVKAEEVGALRSPVVHVAKQVVCFHRATSWMSWMCWMS